MQFKWGAHTLRSKHLYERRHRITSVQKIHGKTIVSLRCENYGCPNRIKSRDITEYGRDICAQCNHRSIDGFWIKHQWIWDLRERILNVRLVEGKRVYTVRCANEGCEKICDARTKNLRGKRCRTCKWVKKTQSTEFGHHWWHLNNDAKNRGIEVRLDEKTFRELCSICSCFYCGASFSRRSNIIPGKRYHTAASHLDRMDSAKGYVQDNVVACCARCNTRKGARRNAKQYKILVLLEQGRNQEAAEWCLKSDDDIRAEAADFIDKELGGNRFALANPANTNSLK